MRSYFGWIEWGFRPSLYWKQDALGSGNLYMWIQVPVHSFSDRVCQLRVGPTPLLGDPVMSLLDLLTFFSPLPPSKNPLSRLRVKKKLAQTDSCSSKSLIFLDFCQKVKSLFSVIWRCLLYPRHEVGKLYLLVVEKGPQRTGKRRGNAHRFMEISISSVTC